MSETTIPIDDRVNGPTFSAPVSSRGVILAAVTAGLLAGLVAWGGGESIRGQFQPAETTAMGPGAEEEARRVVAGMAREASIAFTILGGSLGLALGVAGGLVRRSLARMAAGGTVGLALGLLAAAGAAGILLPIAGENRAALNEDLLMPLMLLGGIWSAIGLAGGIAFGVGLGGRERILAGAAGGLIGAAIGTGVFLMLGAVMLPLAQASSPIPTTAVARLLARLSVALGAGLGVGLAIRGLQPARPAMPRV